MPYEGEDRREQWYTNKEIYEMVVSLKDELRKTQDVVVKYNGIRTDLTFCMEKILEHEHRTDGKNIVGQAIRDWGGWLFALAVLLYKVYGTG